MLIIKNANIHDMVHREPYIGTVTADHKKICGIKEGKNAPVEIAETDTVIDASGLELYPGLVDAHSHLGLSTYAVSGDAGRDYNEVNDICTPQMRPMDSFNPFDVSVRLAREGGVTCVGTGPGSSNALGGVFMAVKTYGRRVDDMIVKCPVAMKAAFGENPKMVYKPKGKASTRMSTAFYLRDALIKAQEYDKKKNAANGDPSKMPPYDMKNEALLPLLHREIPLKAHAHRTDDIFTAIRIAKEFNLKLTLEHVTEGHLIADILAEEGYPCAVGPSLGTATKEELRNKSFATPGILSKAGCTVSIITDASAIPQEYLGVCAGLAVREGMDSYEALKAITINAAKHLTIEDRVGSIEMGKDADFVLSKGDILSSLSPVMFTIIDGKVVYEREK